MGFFDFAKRDERTENINEAVRNHPKDAVFLDVRNAQEYAMGHIPGSVNVPVMAITRVGAKIPQKDTPLYVYCQSGARSNKAVRYLRDAGYTNVTNVGGLNSYRGPLEKP
ncbi:MAG: rhodanese-like domain-containing protein [Clostridia bacterium]|nr:rhodanese-like domain-containing protein [Clostridia bacterium]